MEDISCEGTKHTGTITLRPQKSTVLGSGIINFLPQIIH